MLLREPIAIHGGAYDRTRSKAKFALYMPRFITCWKTREVLSTLLLMAPMMLHLGGFIPDKTLMGSLRRL